MGGLATAAPAAGVVEDKSAQPMPAAALRGGRSPLDPLLDRLISFFTSLRLTVVCLALGMVLVFAGTLAQVEIGLYKAQAEFFHSFFVYWGPIGASWKIPVFPGGYLIGGVLLINLIASEIRRLGFAGQKAGLWLVHIGLILLLAGQLLTDLLSKESGMQLFEGESKNYSEDFRANELVLIDKSAPENDRVYSIPERRLASQTDIRDARLPFALRVSKYWVNADLVDVGKPVPRGATASGATAGPLKDLPVVPEPPVADSDHRNTPAAVVQVENGNTPPASFLVSTLTGARQSFTAGGKTYEITLRPTRYYYPFALTLLKATHEKYKGTDIPKNFASRVRVQNPARGEARETVIYMNNPLRYGGLTFYQYQMSADEMTARAGLKPSSTLQVVRNPGWLTPYISCLMISAGLLIQFMSHLVGFVRRRTGSELVPNAPSLPADAAR